MKAMTGRGIMGIKVITHPTTDVYPGYVYDPYVGGLYITNEANNRNCQTERKKEKKTSE